MSASFLEWKVRAQHQQRVTFLHGQVPGGEPQEASHPHVKRIVVLDEFLPAHRMDDRGTQRVCGGDDLRMRAAAAGPAENRHLHRIVQEPGSRRHIGLGCADRRTRVAHVHPRRRLLDLQERHVARKDDDGNPRLRQGGLNGDLEKARYLSGMRDHFAKMAAVGEEPFRMGFLEVFAAKFTAGYMRSDRQHGNAASLTVIQAVPLIR